MRRVVLTGPRTVSIRQVPTPARGAGEALIEVGACGLCTLEQRVYRGSRPRYPFAGGHEVGGVVHESAEANFPPGTVVAVSRLPRCQRCRECMAGHDNRCAYLSGAMADEDGPGGLSDFLVVPCEDLEPVAGSPADAALVEPLACALHSLHSLGLDPGAVLAIIGNGFMGVLHARAAAAIGMDAIVVETGPTPIGLDGAWEGRKVAHAEALDELGPASVDAAIIIREPAAGLALAGELTRPGGTISMFASVTPSMIVGLPASTMRAKELTLTATVAYRRRDFGQAASLISNRQVIVSDLIYKRFSMDDAAAAFSLTASCDTARVLVEPSSGK